ncbi:hypothetical protein BDA99DRAFT_524230 [Phascolomyces articulosus]|uniref:Uncharacterized protein n=1 Tax=Phascolomyces articulosus TaxID=60185 RepID=A0AAD5K0B0_9FUNG|nr:hypothetical protein BDA99DRAFT_524230 [Phascolomyces articulosus]
MSRTTASDTSSTSRSHVFPPFRSRTAPEPESSTSTASNSHNHNSYNGGGRQPRTPKPHRKSKKKNSLFRFNREHDTGGYNQPRPPSTPTVQDNRHARSDSLHEEDDDEEDDYSDNGTVQPGQGRYTLRVINPDPESSSDEDEEEENKKKKSDTIENNQPTSSSTEITHNHAVVTQQQHSEVQQPVTAVIIPPPQVPQENEPCPVKLEINHLPPPPPQHDRSLDKAKSPMQFVTSFLSTAPSPTASSLSLTSSSRGGTGTGSTGAEGSSTRNHIQSELVRRESKTLEEHVLGPASPHVAEDEEDQEKNNKNKVMIDEDGLLVASPSTLTPQATSPNESQSRRHSGTSVNKFMPPPSQPFFASTTINDHKTFGLAQIPERRLLSPSIGEGGILPSSSVYGNRSIATTANESVLTSTMTRAPQSKYSKASYSLTNNRESLKLYREMAEKTNDKEIQLTYANYLLEIAQFYDSKHTNDQRQQPHPQSSASSTLPQRGHHRATASFSMNTNRRQSRDSTASIDGRLNDIMKRGRASLNGPIRNIKPLLTFDTDNSMDNKEKKRVLEEEGVRWIKRLAKEEVGEAAFTWATWMDEEKYGCRPNPIKSFRLYEIAARKGKPEAMYAVAQYHERDGNHVEALKNYKAAAEKGLVDSVLRLAQVNLHGELSQRQNMVTGLALLAQAAENANESYPEPICVFAQVLANAYPRADIPAELVQTYGGVSAAKEWFERGAALGHAKCHSQLGYMYEHGLFGVPVDMSKSFRYNEAAAQLGDAEGMLGLSRLYNEGCHGPGDTENRMERDVSQWLAGLGRNEDASFLWCQRAAEQGLDEALFLLGWYLEIGFGTPRNLDQAQLYYRRAAAKGHHAAKERLQSSSFASKQHENATASSHRALQDNRRDSACTIM